MKHIVFVDDEPKLLDGLKRSLRDMRNEWDMTFATSGEEALKVLEGGSIDVMVSDMRMPGMDGATLLNEVQRRYPHVVRIILSGHSDREMILRSIGATHRFLAKPCETEQLKATIQRAFALRELLSDDFIRLVVAGTQTVPSLPALYTKIKAEVESPASSLKTIGDIIAQDMGMTAKILQLANSAYFGLRMSVSTVEQAIHFLGLDTVQALVLTAQIFSQFAAKRETAFNFDQLWKASLATGALARAIARSEQLDRIEVDQAYTAGLLHDVGILVLATNVSDRYSAVLARASTKGRQAWEEELSEFATTHAEVGGYLLGLWGLNDAIIEAIAYHHRPRDAQGEGVTPLTAVHVANVLHQHEIGQVAGQARSQLDMEYLERLHLTDRLPAWQELATTLLKESVS
jgi:HD-like signal output (HDOD) protein/ActR/RegA family two-component response regulator